MACENVVRRGDIPTEFLSGYIDLLMATTSVFYDLNAAALPNAFNDNRDAYIQGSLALLSYRNAGMPSSLSPLKCQICSNLTLYATRYEEAFQPCVSICVRAVWELLAAPEQNHELAAAGMIFLSAVARGTFNNPSPFAENTALQAIFDKVILPNLQVTQCDVELFRDDPREYTARNLEGADQDTCRRAAIDLVISLRKHHDARVGEIVVDYASKLLAQAEGAGLEREMLCKDACLSLVTALAGSRPSNLHARVLEGVFSAVVAPELTCRARSGERLAVRRLLEVCHCPAHPSANSLRNEGASRDRKAYNCRKSSGSHLCSSLPQWPHHGLRTSERVLTAEASL